MKANNPYETLGVKRDASPDEIKKAHRRGVRAKHPDRGGKKEDFHKVQEAYEILSDPERKKLYDETGKTASSSVNIPMEVSNLICQMVNEGNVKTMDFVELARQSIEASIVRMAKEIEILQKRADKFEEAAIRMKSKEPVVIEMLKQTAALQMSSIDALSAKMDLGRQMLEFLEGCSYQVDVPADPWAEMMTSLAKSSLKYPMQ